MRIQALERESNGENFVGVVFRVAGIFSQPVICSGGSSNANRGCTKGCGSAAPSQFTAKTVDAMIASKQGADLAAQLQTLRIRSILDASLHRDEALDKKPRDCLEKIRC